MRTWEQAYEQWVSNVCWETAFKNQNDASEESFKAGYEQGYEDARYRKQKEINSLIDCAGQDNERFLELETKYNGAVEVIEKLYNCGNQEEQWKLAEEFLRKKNEKIIN